LNGSPRCEVAVAIGAKARGSLLAHMREPRNRVVQVRRFGGPDGLKVVDAPLPTAGRGEVRVRVLAASVQYTDVLIVAISTRKLRPTGRRACWDMMLSGKSINSALACAAFRLGTAWPI
jgi:hypothetical protein